MDKYKRPLNEDGSRDTSPSADFCPLINGVCKGTDCTFYYETLTDDELCLISHILFLLVNKGDR